MIFEVFSSPNHSMLCVLLCIFFFCFVKILYQLTSLNKSEVNIIPGNFSSIQHYLKLLFVLWLFFGFVLCFLAFFFIDIAVLFRFQFNIQAFTIKYWFLLPDKVVTVVLKIMELYDKARKYLKAQTYLFNNTCRWKEVVRTCILKLSYLPSPVQLSKQHFLPTCTERNILK